jgi:hypothetical protein
MRVILLFLLIFITGCDPPRSVDNPHKSSERTLINEVTNQTFIQLKMEKGLYPFGTGGGGGVNQIRMLALSFRYYKEIEIEEARELLMAAGTLFLKNINSTDLRSIEPRGFDTVQNLFLNHVRYSFKCEFFLLLRSEIWI